MIFCKDFGLILSTFIANNFLFEIYNNQGKIVKEGEIEEAQKLVDFDLKPGVYYMSLLSKSSTYKVTKKIIIN